MNAQEFMRLPVTHGRIELWQGVVHERPFLDAASGCAINSLMVEAYCPRMHDRSIVGLAGGTGFQIGRDPDTVIAPNGAFYVNSRLGRVDENVYLTLAPDIVVEARLWDDADKAVDTRVTWWLRFGVKQIWMLDAHSHVLTIYEPGKEPVMSSIEDTFSGGDVLSGFTLPIRKLFRDAK